MREVYDLRGSDQFIISFTRPKDGCDVLANNKLLLSLLSRIAIVVVVVVEGVVRCLAGISSKRLLVRVTNEDPAELADNRTPLSQWSF